MKFLICSMALLLAAGCGQSVPKNQNTATDSSRSSSHKGHEGGNSLSLDNGQKWKVDSGMLPHLRNMEQDLKAYGSDQTKNHKALAVSLQTHTDHLTAACTMKGEAHDQLHIWLLPHLDRVKQLSDAADPAEAQKIIDEINSSFTVFNEFFE